MGTILNGVVGMTSRPLPVYLVPLADLIKLVPKVLVQHEIPVRFAPAVGAPLRQVLGDSFLDVLRIGHQKDAAWRCQRTQTFDGWC